MMFIVFKLSHLPVAEIIRRIDDNEDRDYNVNVFIKRMRRIEKNMSSDARRAFADYIPDGDVNRFANNFKNSIRNNFAGTMRILNNQAFQALLISYPRAKSYFYVAHTVEDVVDSQLSLQVGLINQN
jgi:phosphate uptake regulator